MILGSIEQDIPVHELLHLAALGEGELEIIEAHLQAGSPAIGRAPKDLDIPEGCSLFAVIRDGVGDAAATGERPARGRQGHRDRAAGVRGHAPQPAYRRPGGDGRRLTGASQQGRDSAAGALRPRFDTVRDDNRSHMPPIVITGASSRRRSCSAPTLVLRAASGRAPAPDPERWPSPSDRRTPSRASCRPADGHSRHLRPSNGSAGVPNSGCPGAQAGLPVRCETLSVPWTSAGLAARGASAESRPGHSRNTLDNAIVNVLASGTCPHCRVRNATPSDPSTSSAWRRASSARIREPCGSTRTKGCCARRERPPTSDSIARTTSGGSLDPSPDPGTRRQPRRDPDPVRTGGAPRRPHPGGALRRRDGRRRSDPTVRAGAAGPDRRRHADTSPNRRDRSTADR